MGLEVIQHLRGTAEENDNRVGYDGEFTVDKTNKAIRIHDGNTSGGSVVISEESKRVSDINELKNLYPSEHRIVFLEGYNNPFDKGSGVFFWDSTGSASNSDGGIIIESNVSGFTQGDSKEGVWKRLYNGKTWNIEWWGLDSNTTYTSKIQSIFDLLPNSFNLKIDSELYVNDEISLNASNLRVFGRGSIGIDNNNNYNQVVILNGNDINWEVNIDQTRANSHTGDGRGLRVNGEDVTLKNAVFEGQDFGSKRPNIYIDSTGRVKVESCELNNATSEAIEYNKGTLFIRNVQQDSSDNTVSLLNLKGSVTPGDIKVEGLDVVSGTQLLCKSEENSLKIQRNLDSPRIFNGNNNPEQLGLSVKFKHGDKVKKKTTSPVDSIGWICVSTGFPGKWKEYGKIKTKNSDSVLFDGNGTKKKFYINHGFNGTPSVWDVIAITSHASVYSYVEANPDNLIVNFDYPPPTGTKNVGFNWEVDRNNDGLINPNKSLLTEESGKERFDGDGSKTTFKIFHGLAGKPFIWKTTSTTSDSSNIEYVNSKNRFLEVEFENAPPSGQGNVELCWSVDSGFFDESNENDGGTKLLNGDDTSTSFSVSHDLGKVPNYLAVQDFSDDFDIDYYVSVDQNNLTLNFDNPPPNGTKNVKFSWITSIDEANNFDNENWGEVSFDGDGSSTTYSFSHGLNSKPTVWNVTPTSSDSSNLSYVNASSSEIFLNFESAPPSGTDNISVNWIAKN